MNRNLIIILVLLFTFGCNNQDRKFENGKLLGNDYQLFENTPIWALAKAVRNNDTAKIKELVFVKRMKVDYQETKFGNTLLMLSIVNNQYETSKVLLNLGANVNLENTYRGVSAMIEAANNDEPKYLELLLAHKGNPNAIENAPVKVGDMARETALNKAISFVGTNGLVKVKLLVEAGADVNYFNEGNPAYTNLPLGDALIQDKMDIVLYLLQQGADYKKVMYLTVNNQKTYILEALRKSVLDLNSLQYKMKLDVIAFLKRKGLNYEKEPIPEYILKDIKIKYPGSWKGYVKRY
ncbi:ankyrin repeat domain-containing protein [Pedobacter sp. UBA5917]|jgi:ankyrin repeat protein|uniref:ankyrin repeat domain-containing protein n=1 Tax=Pedobacter sp. UBA5917 TaxID=1947061 RepID=UPI0025DCFD5C|nr:ankyrin repeat domain-containing protein [Pedobacter sp. UBA5917]